MNLKSFKNDINERMNTINDMTVDNMRRLPLNNNIRDSQITTGSKRDQFNERLSNFLMLNIIIFVILFIYSLNKYSNLM